MAGAPPSGSGGTDTFTVVATNTVAPAAHQSFHLVVGTAPVISSADHATFTVGEPTSFTVTVTPGLHPSPAVITETGTLPSGVTMTTEGDDTASLAGTPAAGTAGTWQITVTATNGVTPPAVQDFTLRVVKQVPVVTWATPAPILYGTPLSSVQLDASTPVAGTFGYTPPAGTVLPPGTDTLHAVFTPSTPGTFASVDATVTVSVGFTEACLTSTLRTKLVVGRGQVICARGGAVLKEGAVVDAGGVLWMTGATADGLVASDRGSLVTICGSDLAAGVEAANSTGPVTIGGADCAGDRISSVLNLVSNTDGVSVEGDTIAGRVIVEHNRGPFVDEGNTVLGRATVRTNS